MYIFNGVLNDIGQGLKKRGVYRIQVAYLGIICINKHTFLLKQRFEFTQNSIDQTYTQLLISKY